MRKTALTNYHTLLATCTAVLCKLLLPGAPRVRRQPVPVRVRDEGRPR